MVRVRDSEGIEMVAISSVFCESLNEKGSFQAMRELYALSQLEEDIGKKLNIYSLVASNFDSFSSFEGFL